MVHRPLYQASNLLLASVVLVVHHEIVITSQSAILYFSFKIPLLVACTNGAERSKLVPEDEERWKRDPRHILLLRPR